MFEVNVNSVTEEGRREGKGRGGDHLGFGVLISQPYNSNV